MFLVFIEHGFLVVQLHLPVLGSETTSRRLNGESDMRRKRRNYFSDLKADGYGVRATISGKVKEGKFPAPLQDEHGRPFWTDEMLDEQDASLEPYHPEPIKQIIEAKAAT